MVRAMSHQPSKRAATANPTAPQSPRPAWQRNTRQREALRSVFGVENHPMAVAEVLKRAQAIVPSLNGATVYRNLGALVQEGWLVQFTHPEIGTLFERAGHRHHHHFLCRLCRRVFNLEGCSLDPHQECPVGFVAEGHVAFIHGLCEGCARTAPKPGRPRRPTPPTPKGATP